MGTVPGRLVDPQELKTSLEYGRTEILRHRALSSTKQLQPSPQHYLETRSALLRTNVTAIRSGGGRYHLQPVSAPGAHAQMGVLASHLVDNDM